MTPPSNGDPAAGRGDALRPGAGPAGGPGAEGPGDVPGADAEPGHGHGHGADSGPSHASGPGPGRAAHAGLAEGSGDTPGGCPKPGHGADPAAESSRASHADAESSHAPGAGAGPGHDAGPAGGPAEGPGDTLGSESGRAPDAGLADGPGDAPNVGPGEEPGGALGSGPEPGHGDPAVGPGEGPRSDADPDLGHAPGAEPGRPGADAQLGRAPDAGPGPSPGESGDSEGPGDPEPSEDSLVSGDPDDDVWTEEDDDRTAQTLAWLRGKRRAYRREQGRDLAVLLYCVVLGGIGYGSGLAVHFLRELENGADYSGVGRDLQRGLPALFTTFTVALALFAARDALWRGPVVVPGPTVGWLLAQPVRRAAVLRPWFRLSAGLALIPGVLAGTAGGIVLRVTGRAAIGPALLGMLPAALCLPLLAVALGMAVERRPRLIRAVQRYTAPAVLLLGALAAQSVLAATGHRLTVLEWIELWSGPWGWAAQPVVRATGGSVPGWPAAVALLVAATAAAVHRAYGDAARVPTVQLRERAATATTVSSVIWSMELRAAKLAIMEAGGGTTARGLRLPPPRGRLGRRLIVEWRDLLALLRAPGRLGKAAVWTACGAATAGLGVDLGGERRVVGLVAGLLFGYVAVGALTETARLETDDVRRAAWAPFRLRTLMLHHAVVPAVLGVVLGLLAAIPFAVTGTPWALLLIPLCAPPFTAASLFSACRGPARTQLLFLGGGSPVGGPGPFIFFAWYAAGPLISVTALALVLDPALVHGPSPAQLVLVTALLTALLLLLTARAADRLMRT
jgi:hypothetical protein